DAHNAYQRQYYDTEDHARLALTDSPYVRNHVDRLWQALRLQGGESLFEVGAGPGKFSMVLARRDIHLVANDLSPVLLGKLASASGGRIETLCCDIRQVAGATEARFDHALGFFVLHHLSDFPAVFASLARVLRPGARVAFCEPVAWNPLYYLQILFTPNMRFAGEPALTQMRPGVILPAMRSAGFVDASATGYGYFPPFLKNLGPGDRLEQWMDRQSWIPIPHAFQIFSARLPD
ncbi:MAG: methyltransferase domain-containing protein, partial [Burkholderiaceae bacterium]